MECCAKPEPTNRDRYAIVTEFVRRHWRSEKVVVHGKVYEPGQLPGFGIFDKGVLIAHITYEVEGDSCEIVTLASDRPGRGLGTQLLESVLKLAAEKHLRRVWLVTTNDNVHALGFYQKRGFVLSALRPGAVDQSRRIKPEIPAMASNGIPIRDELELEFCPADGQQSTP